jgi:uncharacterized protein YdiU (UPF0061 family)
MSNINISDKKIHEDKHVSQARIYAWNLLKDYLEECVQQQIDPCSEELLEQMNIWEQEYDKECNKYYSKLKFQNG